MCWFPTVKSMQNDLFIQLMLMCVRQNNRIRQRGACRLTVCQTTRSDHPMRGVGFLTEYSYLKPRSLLCSCGSNRGVGPDRDGFATWSGYRFGMLCRRHRIVTAWLVLVWCVYVGVCVNHIYGKKKQMNKLLTQRSSDIWDTLSWNAFMTNKQE